MSDYLQIYFLCVLHLLDNIFGALTSSLVFDNPFLMWYSFQDLTEDAKVSTGIPILACPICYNSLISKNGPGLTLLVLVEVLLLLLIFKLSTQV